MIIVTKNSEYKVTPIVGTCGSYFEIERIAGNDDHPNVKTGDKWNSHEVSFTVFGGHGPRFRWVDVVTGGSWHTSPVQSVRE